MPNRDKLPYRPSAGIMLLNRKGLVFIGRRRGSPEDPPGRLEWQMPQGGIDAGENPSQAALRELYEETNVRSVQAMAELDEWLSYDIPPEFVGKGWTKRYRGQTQKWFVFRFVGPDSEIDIASPGGGHHKAEFDAWRWEALERLPDLIVPFKRPIYQRLVNEFKHLVA